MAAPTDRDCEPDRRTTLARMAMAFNETSRRVGLAAQPQPEGVRRPDWQFLMGEAAAIAQPARRWLSGKGLPPVADHPQVVMLLPGFVTHPVRMSHLARELERAGHIVKRWGMGFNLGVGEDTMGAVVERLETLADNYRRPVVLVGWSLGGIFAREAAKLRPDLVARVITMGTPFSGSLRANNAWRVYHLVTGHAVENPPFRSDPAVKPPVPTTALWSSRDGIVSPRSARGRKGERDRAIGLRCSHNGFLSQPDALAALLAELDLPDRPA